jgi:AhpD family alkylhydroperoxidase
MPELDPKTKEMVAIAASVAGNCIPCLRYHFGKAVEAGCTKQEIQEVIEIANMVKQRPIGEINKVAVQMLGTLKEEAKDDSK